MTLTLDDSKSYTVSGFAATQLYKGQHTYIYAAAIVDPVNERNVVGGIGIVCNAAPQFSAMLNDALQRDEKGEVPTGPIRNVASSYRQTVCLKSFLQHNIKEFKRTYP